MGMFHSRVSDNPPVGSCVQDKLSFDASIHDARVVDCAQAHWAEIIGYPTIYGPGSSWPGDAVIYAAAEEACQRVAVQRNVPAGFRVNIVYPGQDWWQSPKQRIYAVCAASRTDDVAFPGGIR